MGGTPASESLVYAAHVLTGDYARQWIAPPTLSPKGIRAIVEAALATHELHPFAHVEDLVEAENWELSYQHTPRSCGLAVGKLLIVPHAGGPASQYMLAQHERSHAWLRRLGLRRANEADAWLVAAEFVWPSYLRSEEDREWVLRSHPFAPWWCLRAIDDMKAA